MTNDEGQVTLDLAVARETRDAAVDAVGANSGAAWTLQARQALANVARSRPFLLVDEVWALLDQVGVPRPDEARAMGAVVQWARSEGLIEPTDTFQPSAQVQCHCNPRRLWRSLVYAKPGRPVSPASEERTPEGTKNPTDAFGAGPSAGDPAPPPAPQPHPPSSLLFDVGAGQPAKETP